MKTSDFIAEMLGDKPRPSDDELLRMTAEIILERHCNPSYPDICQRCHFRRGCHVLNSAYWFERKMKG